MIPYLIGTIVIGVLIHLVHYVRYRKFYQVKLPGPYAWPFIGNANLGKNRWQILTRLIAKYGTLRLWFGPLFVVFVSNPEDVQVVLNSPECIERHTAYRFTRSIVGDCLINKRGECTDYSRARGTF